MSKDGRVPPLYVLKFRFMDDKEGRTMSFSSAYEAVEFSERLKNDSMTDLLWLVACVVHNDGKNADEEVLVWTHPTFKPTLVK
jgi:hypothetical protein